MKSLRLKFVAFLILALFCKFPAFSQDLRQKAEENPLSTVFYLLSTTDKNSKEEQKTCLAKSLASVDRFDEIEDVAEMLEKNSYADEDFVTVINNLIAEGKVKESSKLVSFLIVKADDNEYILQKLFKPLILLKRDDEIIKILNKFSDPDKIDGTFELERIYLELNQSAKALKVLANVTNLVENSKYDEDKATLGLYYAKLGKTSEALKFSQAAMKNLAWKTGKPEYTEGRIIDRVVETYQALGKNSEANEILAKQGKSEEPQSLNETAESYLAKGNYTKAKQLLEQSFKQLNPKEYSDSFDLGRLVEIYLKFGEIEKAEKIAKSLSGSDYMQQKQLLDIADFHIKRKNNSKSFEVLNFALEQTQKIDTSEEENGHLWTSGKWKQAQYQSQIALRFINMKADRRALDLISQIRKPYLRALMLTEFVNVNKTRLAPEKLSSYLEESLSLLRQKKTDIFDSKKFDVYAITARNFAEIGLKEKAKEVFADTLSTLSKEMIEDGSDSSLLFAMCSIGVEFDKSNIKPNEKLKNSLREIIKNWENEDY